MPRELPPRPRWWPDWVPEACPAGHPWRPTAISTGSVRCECQGAVTWHHTWRCGSCHFELFPPDHTGPEPDAGPMPSF